MYSFRITFSRESQRWSLLTFGHDNMITFAWLQGLHDVQVPIKTLIKHQGLYVAFQYFERKSIVFSLLINWESRQAAQINANRQNFHPNPGVFQLGLSQNLHLKLGWADMRAQQEIFLKNILLMIGLEWW